MPQPIRLLIVEARFYEDLAEELARGAIAAIEAAGASFERLAVPGALEIPAAIGFAAGPGRDAASAYDGYLALGCVIRGETSHYDIVAGESARGLMDLSLTRSLAIGNGILTVEDDAQAWARAKVDGMDKGGAAARAALVMVEIKRKLEQRAR